MDTAKFCGNCGNPFPRPAAPTSSLINCAQGHVYSAVYEYCPYCPQPESRDSDFITRVEEPITAVDPAPYAHSQSPNDFATRIDSNETLFETAESPSVRPPAAPPPAPAPAFISTELVTNTSPPDKVGLADSESFRPAEGPEPPILGREDRTSQPLAPPTPQATSADLDRRTTVMADQSSQLRKSKGRIVGWLVTYSHNTDGEDFRVYAGYNRIGANPVCDIQLEDETVSGSHAIIVYRDGRCLIKDDLSRNGTFVNGREITEAHPLQSYDQVRIGNTYLTFVAAQRIS
ncbi:MAG: FHA domain-containing protein [Acidobacteria bacterium]|nr:FHA domain-containing protein [Acidobacteriota bacterium]